MFDVDAYDRTHSSGSYYESIVGGIPLPSILSIDSLPSLGRTINLIDNCHQYFSKIMK